ncbi:MAG: hypothetical protein H8E32_02840 [Nitrospinae bacterium]|nr:hypothetical protein [Nitrospinota bacterium]
MRWNFKSFIFISKALLGVFVVLILYFLFSPVYSYGVDKNKHSLKYRTYYAENQLENADFSTVIFTTMQNTSSNFNNYKGFTVHIDHLTRENGSYVSKLIFNFDNKQDVKVLSDSIKITHETIKGRAIAYENIEKEKFQECLTKKHYWCHFNQIYGNKKFPEQIKESIYFKILLDGKPIEIEEDYVLDFLPHFTLWDVLMGI